MWQEAAEDYERALNLGAPVDEPQWKGILALFHLMGYHSAFEQLRDKYLSILKESNSKPKWNVLRSLVVLPIDTQDVALVTIAHNWLEQNVPLPRRPNEKFSLGLRPRGGRPTHDFPGSHDRAEHVPPFECEYISGMAFLRAGRELEAVRWLRSAAAAREWPARGLVDNPLAIAYQRQGKSSEASDSLRHSDQQIELWLEEAVRLDPEERKLPWYFLVEALAMHRDATQELKGTLIDNRPQIEAIRAEAFGNLDGTDK
jgi:hypothetical protein